MRDYKHIFGTIIVATLIFTVIYHVWFFVMGGFAVCGVVWVIKEFNRNNKP